VKIAYHNPLSDITESWVFKQLQHAGQCLGHQLFDCYDERDIESCRPDFVLSVSTLVPKIVDTPSYLALHQPKAWILEDNRRLRNILSYDGYLTISDSLARLARDIGHGIGIADEPGFFHPTPRRSGLYADWQRDDLGHALRIVYCGTDYAGEMPGLLRALVPSGVLHVYGPEAAWAPCDGPSYRGPVPLDVMGPQRLYAAGGIGLSLISEPAQRDNVISTRLFQITSVGAVAICPDIPWIRKWYGQSVLYFDPKLPQPEIAHQVRGHHAFCFANPGLAARLGAEARQIFEEHFSAERMLANLVAYHQRKVTDRARRVAVMPLPPQISVVIRCGGRNVAVVRRAVNSVRHQTYGRFTIILAKYRPIDLSAITEDLGGAITDFNEFFIPWGGRAQMLFEGIKRVEAPYFAVLDDDDFWLSDHIEGLFRAGWRVRPDFETAFSGVVEFDYLADLGEGLRATRHISRFGFDGPIKDAGDIQAVIHLSCFVARRDLLSDEMLRIPDMRTAEDSLLISYISWRSKPIFSFRPTAFYLRDSVDGSDWQRDEQRSDDELSLAFRGSLTWAPIWLAVGSLARPIREAARIRPLLGHSEMGEYIDRVTLGEAGGRVRNGLSVPEDRGGVVCFSPPLRLAIGGYVLVALIDPAQESAQNPGQVVATVDVRWVWGAQSIGKADIKLGLQELILEFMVEENRTESPIEFCINSHGIFGFVVRSIGLHATTNPK
jgi:hypothetical protein